MTDFDRLKFYDCQRASSPRRVRIYLAEKGITLPTVEVDVRGGEHLQPAFAALNPRCEVPALQLADGTVLGESVTICRYLEELQPNPPLFGRDARERALVDMWTRRLDGGLFPAAAEAVRNGLPRFANRALTGPVDFPQIPALAERGKTRILLAFDELNAQLGEHPFVVGDELTVADIVGLVCVDLAGAVGVGPSEERHPQLRQWYRSVADRPSASA